MASTLREIALRAGVSVSTVSRVMNGRTGVSDDVRERVLSLASELEYTPNAAARALVLKRSHLISVFIRTGNDREFEHPYYQEVLDGIRHAATKAGYDLYVLGHADEHDGDDSDHFATRARRHQIDGAIVMGLQEKNIEELVELKIPVVTVELETAGVLERKIGIVESDNFAGGEIAVAHLASLGRKRIAHIAGLLHMAPGSKRMAGYRSGLATAELPLVDEYVVESDFTFPSGFRAMRRLLALPEPPDAVFAASDMVALGGMRAVHDLGLRIPEDVAVVGFDDIYFASLSIPALTTVRQNKEMIGSTACDALVDLIEGRILLPPHVTLPVDLVIRETCGGGRRTSDDPLEFEPISGS